MKDFKQKRKVMRFYLAWSLHNIKPGGPLSPEERWQRCELHSDG